MQRELNDEHSSAQIRILGVNQIDRESGNAAICEGRVIPWLQDNADENVEGLWQVSYRDVIILDEWNRPTAVFNLTAHDLSRVSAYDSLKALLLDISGH